jgi:hypothetical protein
LTLSDKVTGIQANEFRACTALTTVSLGDNISTIGDYAFEGCTALESINIPEQVTSINHCLQNCSSLPHLTIPASVTDIINTAFNGCSGLKSLTFEDGSDALSLGYKASSGDVYKTGQGLFYDCPLESVYLGRNLDYDGSQIIGYSPFYGSNTLYSLTLGDKVTGIQANEFRACTALKTVSLGDNISTIGDYAFEGCTALESINIPEQVTSINHCLQNCSSLPHLTIPASVTNIVNTAFNGCSGLKSLTFEDGSDVLSLGYKAKSASIYILGQGLFYDCPLESVYLGRNLEYESAVTLGCSPFCNQTALTSLTLGKYAVRDTEADDDDAETPTVVRRAATDSDSAAEETVDLGTITEVPANAFMGCTGLTELYVPENVNSIGASAFSGCTGLTDITLADSDDELSLDSGVFTNVDPTTVYVGRELTGTVANLFEGRTNLKTIEFVGGCTTVPDYCIKDCTNLQTLHYGENVTSVGTDAVIGCAAITSLQSDNTVPPTMNSEYEEILYYPNLTPDVPTESLAAYKAANIWEKFWPKNVSDIDGVYAYGDDTDSRIRMEGNTIEIMGSDNEECRIIAINGTVIYNGKINCKIALKQGVYLVVVSNHVYKVISR